MVTWWQVGIQVCGLPRCRLLLGTSPGRCLRWGGSETSPLSPVLMSRVLIVLWHLTLPQNGQNFCHLQAFGTQVSGVGMILLVRCTNPNLFTPNPSHMESQEVYNSVPRQQGMMQPCQNTQPCQISKALVQWSSRQWCWASMPGLCLPLIYQ